MSRPAVSIIIPCYNEASYIGKLLEALLQNNVSKEIIVVEGGSDDDSLSIIQNMQAMHPEIKLLHNPARYVSNAMNIGIKDANGTFIARIDAHAWYQKDYLETCIRIAESVPCENVGGYVSFKGDSLSGKAIAAALSSAWGIGYKIHDTFRFDHYTDTVHFGFWPKSTFEKFGLFDEELLRDQDEELNYRIAQRGGRIFKTASIVTELFVRENYAQLASQYFQYGYFKPLVITKIGQIVRIRHLVPSLLLLYLLSLTIVIPLYGHFGWYPLLVYAILSFSFAVNQTVSLATRFLTFFAFPIIHLSYGLGFIFGILNLTFVRPFKTKPS